MKHLKKFNEGVEEDEIMMGIIDDYEHNNNITIPDKQALCNDLNKVMDDLQHNWDKLRELYDEYEVDTWEDLIIKLIDEELEHSSNRMDENYNHDYSDREVHIEPLASGSDFYAWIDEHQDKFGFDSSEFHDNNFMFDEGKISSRYSRDWCEKVLNSEGYAGSEYWESKRQYYIAILEFMKEFNLKTIRFEGDW